MDKLQQIFQRQYELTIEFQRIEVHNGLCDYALGIPFDIENPKAQKQLRATAWYLVEEIGEVLDATNDRERHEEVIDVFHFLTELLLCSGIETSNIYPAAPDKIDKMFAEAPISPTHMATLFFVDRLSDAIHCLKAKPWKKNPRESSVNMYRHKLIGALFAFIEFAKAFGLTPETLFDLYMGKANVNQERINSGT